MLKFEVNFFAVTAAPGLRLLLAATHKYGLHVM